MVKKTREIFIDESKKIHNNKYDYSLKLYHTFIITKSFISKTSSVIA